MDIEISLLGQDLPIQKHSCELHEQTSPLLLCFPLISTNRKYFTSTKFPRFV